MYKHRKIFLIFALLLIIIAISLFLYSISSNVNNVSFTSEASQHDAGNSEEETFQTTTQNGHYLIGYAQVDFSEPWREVANEQMKAAVRKYPNFDLMITDGMQDNNKQISDIKSMVQKGCNLIIVSPNEEKPLTDIVETVYNSGIPIILLDRKTESNSYTQYIGADNFAIGKMAGTWVSNYLGKNGGNVVEITGSLGTSAQIDRHEGFLEGIKNNPNIKIIYSRSSDWLREKAISAMEEIISLSRNTNEKIDVVYAQNDPSAEGAYTAAKNANMEKEMKFIGIDALPTPGGGIQAVIDGRISVTYYYPQGSKEAIDSAYNLLVKKEPLTKNIKLETIGITKDNAEQVLQKLEKLYE